MKELIKNRLGLLRHEMRKAGLDAYLIYGTDPHLSEYLPDRWLTRAFISGFSGSAGMVVVTHNKAALWTDSRYWLQAETELEGTGIDLVKLRTLGHPEPAEWIRQNLKSGQAAGTDEWCISVNQFRQMKNALAISGIILKEAGDLLNEIWPERPAAPDAPVYEHELRFAGISRQEKIEAVWQELKKSGATMQIITALDDIAWTFNLRGSDVTYNPVFVAYAVVSETETALFVENGKLSPALAAKLQSENIQIRKYTVIPDFLNQISEKEKVLLDPDRTSQAISKYIPEETDIIESLSIPCRLKAIKSDAEIENLRNCQRKDGVAMVEFLYWLEKNIGKTPVTEYTVAEKLNEFRSLQPEFKGISFHPIVGYKAHGAVVHFHVTAENALPVEKNGFLLFDSGGQYSDGTTDITRTVALAKLTGRQKADFTIVLKGMISLTLARFPLNTRGYHLDILARKDLWKHGLNYGHGTGHGIGYFLNVHEGPMSIRQEFNDRTIEAGMVLSNEPALYRPNEYGLRTENMILCRKSGQTEFGEFLEFETLTLCPIDTYAIDKDLLNDEEIEWLNDYHQRVFHELSPLLSPELQTFLESLTQPI